MTFYFDRRSALKAATVTLLTSRVAQAESTDARFRVSSISTISLQSDRYHGWPTLARRQNGELLVVCSGGRETHVCPFGRVELIRSRDEGRTWTFPRTIVDGPTDDRDAGILETQQGTLLVTTFTSLAYEPQLERASATEGD